MVLPPRFIEIKRSIASSYPGFEARATRAWHEVIEELNKVTRVIKEEGVNYIPQINFSSLDSISQDEIETMKRRGCVLIKDVVDDPQAVTWKDELKQFVKANDGVQGVPVNDKQFFDLFWTKPQVQARSHPNLLAATVWLNNLYHAQVVKTSEKNEQLGNTMKAVDLNTPLTYVDRFRIRKPGSHWNFDFNPPHIDGGTIERWEDPFFRKCFEDIFNGNWREHDPYTLEGRLNARSSLYGRPSQSSVFRTFQGWLAMSEIGPTQGTLRLFSDVLLSNAYIILRPFFSSTVSDSQDIYDAKNWKFDISTPDSPGIYNHHRDGGYSSFMPSPELHPHLRLDECMVSVPKVNPGDTVFWHCDVVHSVKKEHTGSGEARRGSKRLEEEAERLRRHVHSLQQESADKEVKIVQMTKRHTLDKEDLQGLNIAADSKQQELELLKRKNGVKGSVGSTPAQPSKVARRVSSIFT